MNCIDAIEGTVKCILDELHKLSVQDRLDDTEYIRSVKAVINATDLFINHNKEIFSEPSVLRKILYSYSKDLWLENLEKEIKVKTVKAPAKKKEQYFNNDGYPDYYYDFIYENGNYPR